MILQLSLKTSMPPTRGVKEGAPKGWVGRTHPQTRTTTASIRWTGTCHGATGHPDQRRNGWSSTANCQAGEGVAHTQAATAIPWHTEHTQTRRRTTGGPRTTARARSGGRDHSPVGGWWWGRWSCSLSQPKIFRR